MAELIPRDQWRKVLVGKFSFLSVQSYANGRGVLRGKASDDFDLPRDIQPFLKKKKIHRRLFACDDTGNLIWCIFSSEISFSRNFKMCSRSLAESLEMIKVFSPLPNDDSPDPGAHD